MRVKNISAMARLDKLYNGVTYGFKNECSKEIVFYLTGDKNEMKVIYLERNAESYEVTVPVKSAKKILDSNKEFMSKFFDVTSIETVADIFNIYDNFRSEFEYYC